jgi:hypothetical protein
LNFEFLFFNHGDVTTQREKLTKEKIILIHIILGRIKGIEGIL